MRVIALISFMVLSGCMMQRDRMDITAPTQPVSAAPGPDRAMVQSLIGRIGIHVRTCYRAPIRIRAARQIVSTLRVRYDKDGAVLGLPQLIGQTAVTPEGQPYAGLMAEAARQAIIRCSPIAAPPELYQNGWDEIDLTFSPKGNA